MSRNRKIIRSITTQNKHTILNDRILGDTCAIQEHRTYRSDCLKFDLC